MYKARLILLLLLLAVTGCASGTREAQAGAGAAAASTTVEAIRAKPVYVRVVRDRLMEGVSQDIMMHAVVPPTSHMTVDFELALPEGMRLAGVESVVSVSATDSTGQDLVGPYLARRGSITVDHINDMVQPNPHKPLLKWFLYPPDEGAETVNGYAVVNVRLATGTRRITLEPAERWTRIDDPAFGDLEVEYQGGAPGGYFAVRPPEAQRVIRRFDPGLNLPGLPNTPSVSDRMSVWYLVDQHKSGPPSLLVYEDVRTVEITCRMMDLPLP